MTTINAEYTLKVKLHDIAVNPNSSRLQVEEKVRDLAKTRIQGYVNGLLLDPNGKVFEESFKIELNQ